MPVPLTSIRTSHAISIRVGTTIVGQIQSWSPSQTRTVNLQQEINAVGTGAPIDVVPGAATAQTIQVARYDLYTQKMEEVWGHSRTFHRLTDQYNPLDVEERWITYRSGEGSLTPAQKAALHMREGFDRLARGSSAFDGIRISDEGELEGIDTAGNSNVTVEKLWYSGCYFSQLGRNLQAQGDRIVNVNATLVYKKVRPL